MSELLQGLELADFRLDLLVRLLVAAALGGVIGIEREWSGKPAGFRTNLLICVGAALLTYLSVNLARVVGGPGPADPARIAAQIVSGIGFLGAGTIIQSRAGVVGLTTAATLWVVAAIGMTVGAGFFVEAIGTTFLVMLALLLLGRVEPYLRRKEERVVRVTMSGEPDLVDRVESMLEARFAVQVLEAEREPGRLTMAYHLSGPARHGRRVVADLLEIDGVDRVRRG